MIEENHGNKEAQTEQTKKNGQTKLQYCTYEKRTKTNPKETKGKPTANKT